MTGQLLQALIHLAFGAIVGAAFFLSLRHMADTPRTGAPLVRTLAFSLIRVAVADVLFWLAARQGAVPVLAMLAGFLMDRHVVMLNARRG